jgi:hypothetical protein
MSSC